MQMDAGLDTGPVFTTAAVPIGAATTVTELHDTLATLGAQTLIETLPAILSGTAEAEPQSRSGVSYAAKVQKSEAAIDWTQPAIAIDRKIRAFAGWPVAESRLGDGRRLRIWAANIADEAAAAEPGTVLAADSRGILVATGHGALRITKLQPPGGRVMQARDWLAAHPLADARFVEQD